jgi:hypothetical protein
MYGRGNQVFAVWKDPTPETCLFYGFSTTGPDTLALSSVMTMPLEAMVCPMGAGVVCNAPFGTCTAERQCACQPGWTGKGCDKQCPINEAGLTCSNAGVCNLEDPNSESSLPYCDCDPGAYGPACEFTEMPKVAIRISGLAAKLDSMAHPNIELPSDVPMEFSYRFVFENSGNARFATVVPAAVTWTYREASAQSPASLAGAQTVLNTGSVSFNGTTFVRAFASGPIAVSLRISYPHTSAVATANVNLFVKDCSCSTRGQCVMTASEPPAPVCMCALGAFGPSCEYQEETGKLDFSSMVLTPDPDAKDSAYGPMGLLVISFARPFADAPDADRIFLNLSPLPHVRFFGGVCTCARFYCSCLFCFVDA